MEGLAEDFAQVALGAAGWLGELEPGRVGIPGDRGQHQQAVDPLVIDTAAQVSVGYLSGHLRQPGQQECRDALQLDPENGCSPEVDHVRDTFRLRLLGEVALTGPPLPTTLTLPPVSGIGAAHPA